MSSDQPCLDTEVFSVHYTINLRKAGTVMFTVINNLCTVPQGQELIRAGLVLRPASIRGQGRKSAKGKSPGSIQGNMVNE